jgi:Protein of unknown function (DUF4232)
MRFRKAAGGALAAACALTVTACASSQSAQGTPATPATGAGSSRGITPTAAASPPVTAAATPGTADGSVTACATSQLKIALTNTGALAGQAGGYLRFANDSQTTCRVTGWPVVAGLTASGQATTLRHAQSTMFGGWQYSAPLPLVTLRPGDSAYAVVVADDLPVGSQTSCPAPDVRLRVAAPGSTSTVLISAWLPGANSYLPACTAINGSQTGETSAITTLAKLPH